MLKVYKLEESDEWDRIVKTFKEYDIYWLSGYVNAFRINGDGEPLLFYYEDNTTRGINVVLRRDVANDKRFAGKIPTETYYDFVTPYGYGGWIVEGYDVDKLFKEYSDWLKQNNIICEFVRFHPMIHNHESSQRFYEVVRLGEVVHMDITSQENIWNNLSSKNRNMIRKAQKNDIKIYYGRFPQIYEKFRDIYNETMNKDNAEKYYYFPKEFYNSLLNDLPENAQVFWAEKNDQVIATSIMLAANKRMNYHLSGSVREYSSLAATNLLLYKAALWGCANGYDTLYLGGGVGSEEDSLFKFKRAFYRGELNHFYIGRKIYDRDGYEKLVAIRGVTESGFFPLYRAK